MRNCESPRRIKALRQEAIDLFHVGVRAADPALAVRCALGARDGRSEPLPTDAPFLSKFRNERNHFRVVAFGKAACATSKAVQELIPEHMMVGRGIAITNAENAIETPNTDIFVAGHPLPNAAGHEAARTLAALVGKAQSGQVVLVLVSGGGSALLPFPPEAVSLSDKISTTHLMLSSGASINEVNIVRKHLSVLKGGGLAALAAPASMHSLILSDVIGDDVSAIASGPTVPDPSTYADAHRILESRRLWPKLPQSVRQHIRLGCEGEVPETPKPDDPLFKSVTYEIIGSNRMSLEAIERCLNTTGVRRTEVFSYALCGPVRQAAQSLLGSAAKAISQCAGEPLAIIAGGETTVAVEGSGRGGRNQEFALAFAIAAEDMGLPDSWVFLSGGTDGRDGPTRAAGGIADPWTLNRIRRVGAEPKAMLEDNDSNRALNLADDLLVTGATGTNVADLQIVLVN